MHLAKFGDRVQVQYVGLFKDGIPIRRRRMKRVLEFTVGGEAVIPGLSLGVVGMAEGEQRRLTLQPGDAFGAVRRKLIKEIPRQRFPSDLELCPGKRLTWIGAISGRRRRVRVVELRPDMVVVDGNHPLAGKVLEMEIHLISLNGPSHDPAGDQHDAGGEG